MKVHKILSRLAQFLYTLIDIIHTLFLHLWQLNICAIFGSNLWWNVTLFFMNLRTVYRLRCFFLSLGVYALLTFHTTSILFISQFSFVHLVSVNFCIFVLALVGAISISHASTFSYVSYHSQYSSTLCRLSNSQSSLTFRRVSSLAGNCNLRLFQMKWCDNHQIALSKY